MSIRTSMTWLGNTNGVLPEYRKAFENAVGHGFSKAVILWDGPDMEAATEIINRLRYIETGDKWDDKIDDIAAEAVNAALGITPKDIT